MAALGVCATRPMLGLKPTMPQKLAGLRKLPPMSEPCASHAVPVASATAAPPEEPAAERFSELGASVEEAHPDLSGSHDCFQTLRAYDFFMRKAVLLRLEDGKGDLRFVAVPVQ